LAGFLLPPPPYTQQHTDRHQRDQSFTNNKKIGRRGKNRLLRDAFPSSSRLLMPSVNAFQAPVNLLKFSIIKREKDGDDDSRTEENYKKKRENAPNHVDPDASGNQKM
jgi:hypothetical protein